MDKEKISRKWLQKAKDDLLWTEASLGAKIYYGACFTAQQAAEKALKAYLLSQGRTLRKIHDLGAFLTECQKFNTEFETLRSHCAALSDYYLEVRYPDMSEFMSYTKKQAQEAYDSACKIVEFVREKILWLKDLRGLKFSLRPLG